MRYSLIKMYATLWICATLVERLPNLALWAHYDDGHGGVSEAVFRYATHALRAKGDSKRLLHLACPSRTNDDGIWAIQRDETINRRCDLACYVLDDDRQLSIRFNFHAFILYSEQKISGLVANKVVVLLCRWQVYLRNSMLINQKVSLPKSSWSIPRKTTSSSPSWIKLSMVQSSA